MNRLMRGSTGDGGYATFFVAEFDKATRDLTFVNAGHNPPMLVRRGISSQVEAGETPGGLKLSRYLSTGSVGTSVGQAVVDRKEPGVRLLTTGGPIIGTFLNGPYEQETIALQSGDILAVYTDGVTEALNPEGIEFGEERLRSILVEYFHLSAQKSAEKVIAKVLEWQGAASQHDDITLIVVKVK
jgi:sigma-B regulation protein RsbU (phosphoserine phosphatase)